MEAKIEGFFQTVIRYLDEQERISNTCCRLQAQIEDHKSQYQMIETVNPTDFELDSMNERLKMLVLKKLSDRISDFWQTLEENVSWFDEKSQLLNKKLEKCLESDQIKNQSLEQGEYITWMAQICSIIDKQALKVQYMILHGTKKSVENKEDQEEIIEDESDYIFQHSKKESQKTTQSFNMDCGDLESLNHYCALFTMRNSSTATNVSSGTPKSKVKKDIKKSSTKLL